jgi:uncharacterized membrane protein (UPF0127 family)
MRMWTFARALVFVALLAVGCGSSDRPKSGGSTTVTTNPAAATSTEKTNATAPAVPPVATKAQPKLRTVKLWLGSEEMMTEIAMSEKEIMTGMMFRTEMAENEGMLFVFTGPHQAAFWMKNTLLPLSCAYIDPDGIILELHDMKPKDETPIPAATARVQYVLEVKQGWFERHKIAVGTQVRTERGTLAETFFARR